MIDESKTTGSWGKPPAPTDQNDRGKRRYHILSNLLTLLFTGLIMAVGFMLPTLLYPYLDSYRGETIRLSHPSESVIAEHIFEEPVTLYPWNLYAENLLRPLSLAERTFLEEKGIPSFLIATLRDHGLQTTSDADSFYAQISNAFRYLDPETGAEQGCFVLVDADIDANGQEDFRCAVDLQGNIISLLFVSQQWDSVQIEAPIGVAIATPEESLPTEGAGSTTEEGNSEQTDAESAETKKTGTGEADTGETSATSTDDGQAGTEQAEITPTDTESAGTGLTGTEEAGATPGETGETGTENANAAENANDRAGSTNTNTNASQNAGSAGPPLSVVEHPPVEEDQNLWSFAYATSREAKAINQQELFSAFRQLELIYEHRYGYLFTMLLPVQPAKPEELPEIEYTALTPTVFATGEYLLYIYDLPDGKRIVLYLDSITRRCVGFNLLRY
jgi:hypothetical protein